MQARRQLHDDDYLASVISFFYIIREENVQVKDHSKLTWKSAPEVEQNGLLNCLQEGYNNP
jgi:hypothetical protein